MLRGNSNSLILKPYMPETTSAHSWKSTLNATTPLLKSTNFIWTGRPALMKEKQKGARRSAAAVSAMTNWGYHGNMGLRFLSAEHHFNQTGLLNTHKYTDWYTCSYIHKWKDTHSHNTHTCRLRNGLKHTHMHIYGLKTMCKNTARNKKVYIFTKTCMITKTNNSRCHATTHIQYTYTVERPQMWFRNIGSKI